MSSKITPGPWVIGYGGMEGDDYAVITSPHKVQAICNLEPGSYTPANARAIAAVPELIAELELDIESLEAELSGWICMEGHETDLPDNLSALRDALKRKRALLAKIEGE